MRVGHRREPLSSRKQRDDQNVKQHKILTIITATLRQQKYYPEYSELYISYILFE